jgi:hypothetical protein
MEVSIRGLLAVAPTSAGVVRLTSAAGVRNGTLDVDIVDVSEGGVGAISMTFLPRGTWVKLQLLSPTPEALVLLDITGVVRRITMIDRRPAYQLGIGFEDLTAQKLADVGRLLSMLEEVLPVTSAVPSGGTNA